MRHEDGAVRPGRAGNKGVGGVDGPAAPGPLGVIATGPTSRPAVGVEEAQALSQSLPRLRSRGRSPLSTSARFTQLVASVWPSAKS